MSIPASPPLPVSRVYTRQRVLLNVSGHLIYKCGGIDKRTIEKFEKVRLHTYYTLPAMGFFHCLFIKISLVDPTMVGYVSDCLKAWH